MRIESGLGKIIFLFFALLVVAASAFAHGDKVIPQIADGPSGSLIYKTKFDISNLSPEFSISKIKVLFFRQDGTPWSIATNQGTVSEITLKLGQFQTIRIETLGTSSVITSGYAIIRNSEGTTIYSEDYEVNISVFYEISTSGAVSETVAVPVGQPTYVFVFPMEIDSAKNLFTGFAIVNLTNTTATVSLRPWEAGTDTTKAAISKNTITFTLKPNEQKARFLNETGLYPELTKFKGLLLGSTDVPVSILGLLQVPAGSSVQYATLASTYADALRKNTYVYLRGGYPLDADLAVVDYFFNEADKTPWDLLYERQSNTTRRLVSQSGVSVSVIGKKTDLEFDNLTVDDLKSMTYSSTNIDMSDSSTNLAGTVAFAVKTNLGRYVKVRVAEVITRTGTDSSGNSLTNKDLALEIFIFK